MLLSELILLGLLSVMIVLLVVEASSEVEATPEFCSPLYVLRYKYAPNVQFYWLHYSLKAHSISPQLS